VLTGALLLATAARMARTRDIGTGVLASKDRAAPHLALLRSPLAQALRAERVGLLFWAAGAGALALVVGVVSKTVTSLGVSAQLEHTLQRLGVGSALTPKAYIGFAFSSLVLVVSLFAVSQIAAARQEEEERLDTLLALPLSRHRWLAGRLGLAAAGAAGISVSAGLLAWVGAVSQGVSLGLTAMLGAGANCLPVAILVLGVAGLAYAAFPRAGTGIAYGLVVVAYLWQLFGSLLGLPKWLVRATPFAHVGALPAGEFRPGAAAIMVGIGLLAGIGAMQAFRRRDLLGA
jgi:ABC-2 type transport system permease protein